MDSQRGLIRRVGGRLPVVRVGFRLQQAAFIASKQKASKRLAGLIADAMRLLTVLRAALKEHCGITSEKLAELGMQPFRGRSRKAALVVPPPEVKPAALPAATPTESPDSES